MKMNSLRFLLAVLMGLCVVDAAPPIKMHRVQAKTEGAAGWYRAESTKGSFGISVPLPFNDYTTFAKEKDGSQAEYHSIGCKSSEGVSFSVDEVPIIKGKTPEKITDIPKSYQQDGAAVSDLREFTKNGFPAVSFTVTTQSLRAKICCVRTSKTMIMAMVEYPSALSDQADKTATDCLRTLTIKGEGVASKKGLVPGATSKKKRGEQGGARQPATAVESKTEGKEKPKPESEARSQ